MTTTRDRYRSIRNVLWAVLALNLAVALAKLTYGIISHSAAMEADGFHSMFDGASNIIGLVGMWFAARPADQDHPYGHGKFETFAAALIGILLIFAGYTVGRGAVDGLSGDGLPTEVTTISFAIMLGTLAVNILVTTWERRAGKRLGSEVLVADASHTLSDVMVSTGVIVSLVVVRLGWQQADGIVALIVAAVILRTAWASCAAFCIRSATPRACPPAQWRRWRAAWRAWSPATPSAPGAPRATSTSTCTSRSLPARPSSAVTRSPTRSRPRCAAPTGRSPTSSCISSP